MRPASGHEPRSGIALLRKEVGLSSFQTLSPVKRRVGGAKVGHAGTLDRFAEGLLVALVGQYTRLVPYVVPGEKTYRGVVRFGAETSTLDPEGEVIARAPVPGLGELEAALPRFIGHILQKPPAYSALHIDGVRAHRRARAGEEIDMPARPVEVYECRLESFEGADATILVRCSAGTYIRSLARDIAIACGSRAHLVALDRRAIGPFPVEDAVGAEDFDPDRDLLSLDAEKAAALGLPAFSLCEALMPTFMNGVALRPEDYRSLGSGAPLAEGLPSAVFAGGGRIIGIVELGQGRVHYRAVLGGGA
ncbi:MAG TPA: tRNA pseudouridine(55) synthase TruB [Rectinemataceae bacterium]|nr:tRNA pseudouridine(55) synthase TruB [Rectinemataceae bacterium]